MTDTQKAGNTANKPLDLRNMATPDFDEASFNYRRWKSPDDSGAYKDVNVYEQLYQELSWIRRILIHGERQRATIIAIDKQNADNYLEHNHQLARGINIKLIFDAFQLAVLIAIAVLLILK